MGAGQGQGHASVPVQAGAAGATALHMPPASERQAAAGLLLGAAGLMRTGKAAVGVCGGGRAAAGRAPLLLVIEHARLVGGKASIGDGRVQHFGRRIALQCGRQVGPVLRGAPKLHGCRWRWSGARRAQGGAVGTRKWSRRMAARAARLPTLLHHPGSPAQPALQLDPPSGALEVAHIPRAAHQQAVWPVPPLPTITQKTIHATQNTKRPRRSPVL